MKKFYVREKFFPCFNTEIIFLTFLFMLLFQSCSKKNDKPSGGGSSSGNSSKYMVDTYAKSSTDLIYQPAYMCVDSKGFLYVCQPVYSNIIKIDPLVQTIGNLAGLRGNPGCDDDPFGSGTPSLTSPGNLWINKDDLIFTGDYACGKVKVIKTTGEVSTYDYLDPNYLYPAPGGACQDFEGNVYLYDTYEGLFEVRYTDQELVNVLDYTDLGVISSMTMASDEKTIYLSAGNQVFRFSNGTLTSIAGSKDSLGNNDGTGAKASFGGAMAICMGGDGNIYIADVYNNLIRKLTPNGQVTTIAGDGKAGYIDDTGDKAEFYNPDGIAYSSFGGKNVLYVSDYYNNVIRRITLPD
ncbi:MAG TPA: hypothetical protein VG847_04955 [Chitinophagaceae bacterium]|nr:hypothetical protein [Chitinophagaceae bacterium]